MRLLVFLLMIAIVGCKNSDKVVNSNLNVPRFDDSISFYDSISAPIVEFDSTAIYAEISTLLNQTREISWVEKDDLYFLDFSVDDSGKFHFIRNYNPPSLDPFMASVVKSLSAHTVVVRPAFMKDDSLRKIPYELTAFFFTEREGFELRICGAEDYIFLSKDFKYPQ